MEVKRMKVKVCLVGEAAVGKTSLIRRFVLDNFDDKYIQTLGTKVSKKELTSSVPEGAGELKIDMTIWTSWVRRGSGNSSRKRTSTVPGGSSRCATSPAGRPSTISTTGSKASTASPGRSRSSSWGTRST